mmetsp:Transcript_6356/g.17907  ORF Transcript_6356/g.17907 Transcript_6356/m.17907 type:complete len:80 (-) Transcript_6356:101-340(-)
MMMARRLIRNCRPPALRKHIGMWRRRTRAAGVLKRKSGRVKSRGDFILCTEQVGQNSQQQQQNHSDENNNNFRTISNQR